MPNSKPPYPPEFRREAVELLALSEQADRRDRARISASPIRRCVIWASQAEVDAGQARGADQR